jgi:GTPase SAR1 family protein
MTEEETKKKTRPKIVASGTFETGKSSVVNSFCGDPFDPDIYSDHFPSVRSYEAEVDGATVTFDAIITTSRSRAGFP